MSKTTLAPDFCVVGAGSGGLSFTAAAVQMGASVVLLESSKMGGDCLNYGCIPSKALIAASHFGYEAKKSKEFGWDTSNPKVDFEKVHHHIHSVINSIAPHDSVERFEKLGAKVILERGSFQDTNTVETQKYLIRPKRVIISTGSRPFIPPIQDLSEIPYYTNKSIFNLKKLPKHLLVIGAGPIGLEMAQAFRRLGSQVTLIEAFTALPKDDVEVVAKLKKLLTKEEVYLHENIQITSLKDIDQAIEVTFETSNSEEHKIEATHVLVATGRRANIEQLNLDAAGIKYTNQGIEVNKRLQTTNSKVYAIGDCIGGYQFTHVAGYHAGLTIRNSIFGLRTKVQTTAIPWVTYTDPELAHVGMLEAELIHSKIEYKVLKSNFDQCDRAQAERKTEGMIKVLASPKGKILGATILAPNSGDLIYPWVIAIQNQLKLKDVANSIAPYPTYSDLSKQIAGSFYKEKIFSAFMKKIVRFLLFFKY